MAQEVDHIALGERHIAHILYALLPDIATLHLFDGRFYVRSIYTLYLICHVCYGIDDAGDFLVLSTMNIYAIIHKSGEGEVLLLLSYLFSLSPVRINTSLHMIHGRQMLLVILSFAVIVVESKTSKINRCFISDAIKETLTEYRKWLGGRNCSPDDYIFSKNNGGRLQEQSYSRYLKNAGKEAGLPIHISSHTMRKSFANIVLCCHDGGANDYAMRDLQGMLGHSDVRITMSYLKDTILRYDEARKAVSDFVLGKTDINELVTSKQVSNNEIYELCKEMFEKQVA